MKTNIGLGRKTAAFAAMGLIFVLAAQGAHAASTDISDVPMAVKNLAPANIMFMLDNSGSMDNIIPDYPGPTTITCAGVNLIADGGVAPPALPDDNKTINLNVASGVQKINRPSGTTGPADLTVGTDYDWGNTGAGKCFDPAKRYNAKLYVNAACPTHGCDAVFSGDYLNWYFYNGGSNFGAGAIRKPGVVSRMEVARTAAKQVIDTFANNPNSRVRVGLSSYNNANGGTLQEIMGDVNSNATSIKSKIDGLTPFGYTPLAEVLSDIGRYFSTGVPASGINLPASASTPTSVATVFETGSGRSPAAFADGTGGQSLTTAPITSFCQRSFTLLMTDGQPNGDQEVSTALRNYKGECPNPDIARNIRSADTTIGSFVLTNFQNAPAVTSVNIGDFVSGPGIPAGATVTATDPTGRTVTISAAATASAASISASFSATSSPCLVGIPGGTGSPNTSTGNNYGRKTGRFYEANGSDYLDDVAKALFEADLRPDLQPPTTTPPTVKNKPNNLATYTIGFGDVQLIEDAGLMQDTATAGGGLFFIANNANELVQAFEKAADDILSKDGSAAAVAVANANVVAGDNASYASSYNSGTWTGDLIAYPLDVTTGNTDVNNPIWVTGCPNPNALVDSSDATKGKQGCSAQVQLDLGDWTTRKIFSYTGTAGTGQGIQFQPTTASTGTKLSTAQQTLLNSTAQTDGAAVLNFLRGNRSAELTTYRLRTHVLGDIVNSEPVVVREPFSNYADTGYSAFKSSNSSRTRIVIQAANDGMVHAFNTATGAEEWAYVPNLVLGNLNNLSKKSGFVHKYSIDGTPVTNDVDFANTDGYSGLPNPNWKTIVVGGLGKGGRGFYALDVTTTTAASESAATAKALWEFPNSATSATDKNNMGFTFGRPIIVKTADKGWVVLVASGFNNGTDSGGDGTGYLFVLNARTGAVIKAISTAVGTAADPSGLANIAAYVDATDTDNTVTQVYGGDLKGNVWRFDLTGNSTTWGVKKLATLVDASGSFQPVTTEPELSKVDTGGGLFKRFIYVGTGLYLGDSDVPGVAGANTFATQTQTMYGLIDDMSNSPTITPLRTSLQQQTLTTNADGTRTASSVALDFATKKGWFVDMTSSGERINTNPALALGALVFTTNIPNSQVCVPGGKSFFNVLDYKTGGYLASSTVAWSSQSLGDALASRVVLIKLPSGAVKALARKSDATTVTITVPVPPSSSAVRRRSWREVSQ